MSYACIRVSSGIYLKLSSNGKDLYRISRYEADGSLSIPQVDGGEREVRGPHWRVERLIRETAGYVYRDAQGTITGVTKAVGLASWEAEELGLDPDDVEWSEEIDAVESKKACLEWLDDQDRRAVDKGSM